MTAKMRQRGSYINRGNEFGTRDIVLRRQDENILRVADTHRFYDAL